jgi:hypothetical protein
MAGQYKLCCLVLPDGKQPITIRIESTATVSELADQVKNKENQTAGHFSLSELMLYRVDVSGDTEKKRVQDVKDKIRTMNLEDDKLDSSDELNAIYNSDPPKQMIHIVVLLPSTGESVKTVHRLRCLPHPFRVLFEFIYAT